MVALKLKCSTIGGVTLRLIRLSNKTAKHENFGHAKSTAPYKIHHQDERNYMYLIIINYFNYNLDTHFKTMTVCACADYLSRQGVKC